jgi:tripartite-type tricarboxylate transporter receptor subunit TctC
MNRFVGMALPVAALGIAAAALVDEAAWAEDFYQGKTITIITSTGEGGGYDAIARSLGRQFTKLIPGNPNTVVQNMPGGGHMLATNYLYNIAPKDGTVIGTVNQNVPSHQVLDGRGVRYDATKFNWLGALDNPNALIAVWHTSPIHTLEDAMKQEVITGATGDGSSGYRYPSVMNSVLGTKFKIIKGYKSTGEIFTAMERGEVQARGGGYEAIMFQHPDWIRDKKVRFIIQIGRQREAMLQDVPLWTEVAKTDEQRQVLQLVAAAISVGRPFLAPPGLPEDRVATLRQAFAAAVKDKDFLADGEKLHFETGALSAEEVTRIVAQTISAPADVVAKVKVALAR